MLTKKIEKSGNVFTAKVYDGKWLVSLTYHPTEWYAYHKAIEVMAHMRQLEAECFGSKGLDGAIRRL